jgi:hypothetical protein
VERSRVESSSEEAGPSAKPVHLSMLWKEDQCSRRSRFRKAEKMLISAKSAYRDGLDSVDPGCPSRAGGVEASSEIMRTEVHLRSGPASSGTLSPADLCDSRVLA